MSLSDTLCSPEFYLDLKGSQFKIPVELAKKNFKNLQKMIEKHKSGVAKHFKQLKEADLAKQEKLRIVNKMIQSQEVFNKKLSVRVSQHNEFIERLICRIDRVKRLEAIGKRARNGSDDESETDGKVAPVALLSDELVDFYKDEINLLVINFLLKTSKGEDPLHSLETNPGYQLAKHLKLTKLIDYDVILQGLSIYNKIKLNKNLKLLVAWCSENKKSLSQNRQKSKTDTNLEFETYFQRFIEMIKEGDLYGALEIANKNLVDYVDNEKEEEEVAEKSNFDKLSTGVALLWYSMIRDSTQNMIRKSMQVTEGEEEIQAVDYYDAGYQMLDGIRENIEPYEELLDDRKWSKLADFFLFNFNLLYGLDQRIPLLNMLSIGGAVLKTKTCLTPLKDTDDVSFGRILNDITPNSEWLKKFTTNQCPICSPDLKELMHILPCSHQVKSNIYDDPVLLPNGNIYPSEKLLMINRNMHYKKGEDENGDTEKDDDEDGDDEAYEDLFTTGIKGDALWKKLSKFVIKDPATGENFHAEQLVKVYPT
ncbi:DEKNAAC104792 [Brettanomyces naardenensis]|uniref:DEKNAAC104792 n=1 Tax=Brettanomyces naardenensis TaxID=13370 RepID=A0A448YSB6_BRENA|nr:DEKNAAC104792 [Brettanomyces naardenensis]